MSNKSCILYYLVPVKMLLGQLPSQEALQKYNLGIYKDIVEVPSSLPISVLHAWSPLNLKGLASPPAAAKHQKVRKMAWAWSTLEQ